MIVKEWTREEIEKSDRWGFHDTVIDGFHAAGISRHKSYRFAMSLSIYGLAKSSHDSNGVSLVNMVRDGHGELFGYPIAIDNSVDGLIFEEYGE